MPKSWYFFLAIFHSDVNPWRIRKISLYRKRKTKCRIDYLDGGVFLVIMNFLLWLVIDNRGGLAHSGSANGSATIGRDKV